MRAVVVMLALAAGCTRGVSGPATLDASANEMCAFCRMIVSDRHFAAQLLEPGEEPRFFDDVGCLGNYLSMRQVAPRAVAYVADHRTAGWVLASRATYTRAENVETPMHSHLIAHADAASRDADPAARGATPVSVEDVFHGKLPEGTPR